ncbi:uncharacterized protein [Setaria viridis]|uniref:uncharacterized protein n=1 Tax=Setaria viridis TaxID=4556 RepID=UPI003B3A4C36
MRCGRPSPSSSSTIACRLQRTVFAQQVFHSLYQGGTEYCGRLKRLSDTLADVGAAVTDLALVVNTLRSLNNKFSSAITILGNKKPPPSFLYTRNYLLQEEKRIEHSRKVEAQMALLIATSASSPTKPPPSSPTSSPSNGGGRKKWKASDHKNRSSGSGSNNSPRPSMTTSTLASSPQWAFAYNPWTGVVQAWPLRPGVLGPGPSTAPTQARMALGTPSASYDANFNTGASGVPPALFSALHSMPAQQPYGGGSSEWLGSAHQDGSPPM